MTTTPETRKETDKTVSGRPLRLYSKLRNSVLVMSCLSRLSLVVQRSPAWHALVYERPFSVSGVVERTSRLYRDRGKATSRPGFSITD